MGKIAAQLIIEKLQPAEHDTGKLIVKFEEVFLLDRLCYHLLHFP